MSADASGLGGKVNVFCYGSNMSLPRLRARIPTARVIASARLEGHELRFHKKSKDGSGKCDAYPSQAPAAHMYGVIFEIHDADKETLDKHEGLGRGYQQKTVSVTRCDAEMPVDALVYIATDIDTDAVPYTWYTAHVLFGARAASLPAVYIDQIVAVRSIADKDIKRHSRELEPYSFAERKTLQPLCDTPP